MIFDRRESHCFARAPFVPDIPFVRLRLFDISMRGLPFHLPSPLGKGDHGVVDEEIAASSVRQIKRFRRYTPTVSRYAPATSLG